MSMETGIAGETRFNNMKESFDREAVVKQLRGTKKPNGTWDIEIDVIAPDGTEETYRFFSTIPSPYPDGDTFIVDF